MSSFEDQMNNTFGGNRANYSVEDIELAKKRQKKYGGTLYDNLSAITEERTGRKPLEPIEADIKPKERNAISGINSGFLGALSASAGKASEDIEAIEKAVQSNASDINATLNELKRNISNDFGAVGTESSKMNTGSGNTMTGSISEMKGIVEGSDALDRFVGLSDTLKEDIFGQDEYLKKLIIAFKRPFVSERDNNDALNSIFISGAACTGRHYSLDTITKELKKRNVLTSDEIFRMDLSLYPSSAEEKLFIQDLYSALRSKASVILFENFASCNVALLQRLSDLTASGESMLNERYIMQNGQLVGVTNGLARDTIGSLEATGKYLVFMGTESVGKLADIMGAPFVNSLGDICVTQKLDEDAVRRVCAKQEKKLVDRVKKQLAFDLKIDESFSEYARSCTSRGRGLRGVLDVYEDSVKALSQFRLERDDYTGDGVTLLYEQDTAKIAVGDEKLNMGDFISGGYSGELEAVEKELDNIVGLTKIKEYIRGLKGYYEIQKRRREEGLKAGELNRHMIFTGNPGTGKTTIARIVSRYLKAIGILSGGQLVEVSRGDLVGRYVGHTAPLVNQVIKSAIGGVLFIDEAYSLYRGDEDSFGLEAIDTLVKGIEDNRDNLVVILAGYSREMEEFLEANSGLKSRFPNIIDFPDYTGEELLAIADITAGSKGYVIDDSARKPLLDFFNATQLNDAREAGNGRLVRNKIEEAILNQSRRLVAEPDSDMELLIEGDFDL